MSEQKKKGKAVSVAASESQGSLVKTDCWVPSSELLTQ